MALWEQEGEADLRGEVEELLHLDEEQLQLEIECVEDSLEALRGARQETQAALRAEVARLASETAQLRREVADARDEAERAKDVSENSKERWLGEVEAAKRRLQYAQRSTQATEQLADKARRYQESAAEVLAEKEELSTAIAEKHAAWESATEALRIVAARVEALEKEKAEYTELTASGGKTPRGGAAGRGQTDPGGYQGAEAKALLSERNSLMQELREARDARELKILLDQERTNIGHKRVDTSRIVEEIAELEEAADHIERQSQRAVATLRAALEGGAARELELEDAKKQADDWLKAVWSALCQQRKDELMLHERMKEDDLWTEQLQKRVDGLVEELRALEKDARALGSGPDPLPEEAELEEDLMRSLAGMRQQRRGAQHALACHMAKYKPLHQALAAAEAEHRALSLQLEPVRSLLDAPYK